MSMKYLFTYLFASVVLSAISGCTDGEGIITDAESSGYSDRVPLAVTATATDFTISGDDGTSQTRASESGMSTSFQAGDAIGIFAVKGGAIVNGISNIRLSYAEVSGGGGRWNPAAGTALYYKDGVDYIAYSPYKEGVTINPAQTVDEITASLTGNSLLQPVANQANETNYHASDLMIATGRAQDNSGTGQKTLTLDFKHQFALLVLNAWKYAPKYKVPAGAAEYKDLAYHARSSQLPDADVNVVYLNGKYARKMSDGVYRAIVAPTAAASTLNGYYTRQGGYGRKISYKGASISAGFEAGKAYSLTVSIDTPVATNGERAPEVGDFYYSDGTIWPSGSGDPDPLVEGCIGIIYKLGFDPTNEANGDLILRKDYPYCTHGLVMGLGSPRYPIQSFRWATEIPRLADGSFAIWQWVSDRKRNDSIRIDLSLNCYQGYGSTKALRAYSKSSWDMTDNYDRYHLFLIDAIDHYGPGDGEYEGWVSAGKSSPWYIPSKLELVDAGQVKSIINTQINKLLNCGADDQKVYPLSGFYWTVSIYDRSDNYIYIVDGTTTSQDNMMGAEYPIRPILAF